MSRGARSGIREVLDGDEVRQILRESFFAPAAPAAQQAGGAVPSAAAAAVAAEPARPPGKRTSGPVCVGKPKPDHYKVICISMYTEDLARLDACVRELKRRGYTKANRSAVLRAAIDQLDLDRVPKGL